MNIEVGKHNSSDVYSLLRWKYQLRIMETLNKRCDGCSALIKRVNSTGEVVNFHRFNWLVHITEVQPPYKTTFGASGRELGVPQYEVEPAVLNCKSRWRKKM
ncbi:unnamed protein product [Heterobilharzia americana]|nr:unnamed protein product [Heterobilharzia americana]CAH8551746.1 unnamed protein product [Heterobilharzia americana]